MLFISHRLDEIFAICDTVTVLRDGEVNTTACTADMDTDELVRWMVGRELSNLFPKLDPTIGETVLEVERLTREGVFIDISFEVKRGEIVALAGPWARVAARSPGPSSASTSPTRAPSPSTASSSSPARPPPCRRASGSCPRTASRAVELSIERNLGLTRPQALRNKLGVIGLGSELATDWATKLQLKFHS